MADGKAKCLIWQEEQGIRDERVSDTVALLQRQECESFLVRIKHEYEMNKHTQSSRYICNVLNTFRHKCHQAGDRNPLSYSGSLT